MQERAKDAWAIPSDGDELMDDIEHGNATVHCQDEFVDEECERFDRLEDEPQELNFDLP